MTAKTAPKITLWEFFQQGKTFMLPVALLSFCGIMLGIGSSLSSHDVLTLLPWLDMPLLQAIFIWMSKVGSFAFSFLPVMFCIAIPLGLARENKGVAAFAGFVGYAVMNLAVNFWLTAKGILPTTDAAILKANNIQNIIGIPSIDTGILGAVIAGIIVWLLHDASTTFACRTPWPSSAAPASCRSSPPWCWVWSVWRSRWCGRSSPWGSTPSGR
jgi:PTS system maltose and glucose-specific IIC component